MVCYDNFYVYTHSRPDKVGLDAVFYVGKGTGKRARNMGSRNPYHKNITAKVGVKNVAVTIITCRDELMALDYEKRLIRQFRKKGVSLTNLNDGGETGNTGLRHTEETKRKQSEAKLGDKNPMRRPEVAIKVSGDNSVFKRPEVRQKIKEKISKPEHKEMRSAKQKETWADPEIRKRRTAWGKSEEGKAAMSARMSERNPSMLPHVKAMRSEWSKRNWDNPDYRKKMVETTKATANSAGRQEFLRGPNNPSKRLDVKAKKSAIFKGIPHKRVSCPHCGTEGGLPIMHRHHFENCKYKEVKDASIS